MVMPQNLAEIICGLYPQAVSLIDFEVVSDSQGVRITRWNTQKLGPQPDEAAILSAKPTVEAAQKRSALVSAIADEIQRRLDQLAQSWGYDSMLSLGTYRQSSVPKFAAESAAGLAWRDAAWLYAENQQGQQITPEQFWSGFPLPPDRPAI